MRMISRKEIAIIAEMNKNDFVKVFQKLTNKNDNCSYSYCENLYHFNKAYSLTVEQYSEGKEEWLGALEEYNEIEKFGRKIALNRIEQIINWEREREASHLKSKFYDLMPKRGEK